MAQKIYTIGKSNYSIQEYEVVSETPNSYTAAQQLTKLPIRIMKQFVFENINDAQQAILDYHLEYVTDLGNKIKEARQKLETFKQKYNV